MPSKSPPEKLDSKLAERLVCPIAGGPLHLTKDRLFLNSPSAKLAFPIRDGVPIMIVSEATKITVKK